MKYKNGEEYSHEQFQKDRNAHASARLAIIIYSEDYREFDYGIMSFWKQLGEYEKEYTRTNAEWILNAPSE